MSCALPDSSSSDNLQSPSIPYQRTKTGCKACRERRIRCQLGALNKDGRRAACVKCLQNLRECVYPSVGQRRIPRQSGVQAERSLSPCTTGTIGPPSSAVVCPISPPSKRSRISLFDGSLPRECESLAMQYLFCGSFTEIGAYGVTHPQRDHFQNVMLPYVMSHLVTSTAGSSAEDDFVTSSAVYFSDVHRRYYTPGAELTTPCKSHARAKCLLDRVRSQSFRGEKSLIGTALYDLAIIFAGGELDLRAEDFEAEVLSPIGYSLYDVLCVYDTMKAIEELREVCAPVPLTGSVDLEHTFGMHRKMYQILAATARLLHQSHSISQLLSSEAADLMRDECEAVISRSHKIAYGDSIQLKDYRIALGTQMSHQAVCIILKKEVLGAASVQEHCDALLALWHLLPQTFLVGVHWTLTLAACYGDLGNESAFIRASPAKSTLSSARGIADLARTMKKSKKYQQQLMPWRDVLRTAHIAVLI